MDEPEACTRRALEDLRRHLPEAERWSGGLPLAREVVGLHRAYEAGRRALAREVAEGDSPDRRALEEGVLRARLVLGAPRPRGLFEALAEARRDLLAGLPRVRFFVQLALVVLLVSGLVGYLAVDADSRLGDLLLAGPAGVEGLASLGDPLGGLLVPLLGPRAAGRVVGGMVRFGLLYVLFLGGLGLGLVPLLALVSQGLHAGVVLARPGLTGSRIAEAVGLAAPDGVALVLACAAGLALAHAALAPGRQGRGASLAAGLRGGAGLWMLALQAHLLAALPGPELRWFGALVVLLVALCGGGRECEA